MTLKMKFEHGYLIMIDSLISVAADDVVPIWAPGHKQLL